MKPSVKLHSIAFGFATALTFALWTQFSKFTSIHEIFKILVGFVASLGLYRAIANAVILLVRRSTTVKKFFLGEQFVGGTWVGYYKGFDGKERYLIERFEQDIDNIVIRGKSFNELFKDHSSWVANHAYVDVARGKLSYMYEVANLHQPTDTNGVASFTFGRDDQYSKPIMLDGYSIDSHLGKRCKAREIKISDYCSVDPAEALTKAKEFFEKNKGQF